MRKAIKNYLAKLHDNKEKGFSLVELIIVIAIMAILVGVVASQVLPYMEKSRKAKDQQQLSSVCTDIVTSISQQEKPVPDFTIAVTKSGVTVNCADTTISDSVIVSFAEIRGNGSDTPTKAIGETKLKDVAGKLKAKASKEKYKITYTASNGLVVVEGGDGGDAKLTAESE